MKKILLFLMFALFCVPWAANAQDTLTVHDENTTTNSYVPVWGLWADNSLQCEIVYPASELVEMAGGVISALKLYTNSTSTNIGNASASSNWDGTFTIFMKEVEATTLSDFTGTTGATTVLEAQIGVVNGEMTIEFTNPYTYGGGNLLVGIYYATGGHYCSVTWVGNSVTGASIYGRSGQSYSATQGNFIPKTTFIYTPGEAACAKPESIQVPEVTAYSANVAWEGGSGTYQLQLKAPTDEDWEDVMFGSYTSFSFEELTPATTYEVRVRSLCGEDPETGEPLVSFWKSISFTTPCAIITSYPWTTNFDDVAGSTSGTTNNLPMCWNYINSSTYSSYKGYPIVYSASATAYSGNNYLRFYSYAYYNTSGTTTYDPQDQYAILPEMEGLDGKQISFFARGHNASSTFKVGLMTDPADASTFTAIATQALTTSYEEYTYDIQGEGNYIAIMIEAANPSRTTNGVYIDDIKVADPPACPKPQSFVVIDSSVTAHTATLAWESEASAWQISLVNGEEEEIIDVEENPYTFTGLAPETTFTVKVRANCGTIVSEWSVEKNFTTAIACPAPTGLAANEITSHEATLNWTGTSESYSVMYRTAAYTDGIGETFETSTIPSGWENKLGLLSNIMNGSAFTSGTAQWNFGTSNGVFNSHARINIYGTSRNGWLITPEITVNEGFNFSFDLALTAFSGTVGAPATTGTDDKFVVLVTTDNEASWTILRQWDNAGSEYVYNDIANSAAGENVNINIDQYIGMNVRFAFYGESTTSNADNNLHIDNVSCGIYHEAGDWQSFVVNEAPAQLTDLEGGTAYNAKLQGDCGVEGLSVETSAITFSTLPACSAPAELACTNITTTSATLTWITGDYPVCQVMITNNEETNFFVVDEPPYTVEGLNPGTTYIVQVRPLCDTSLWSTPLHFTTVCEPISQLPYTENFDSYTGATSTSAPTGYPNIELPNCWQILNLSETSSTYPQAFITSASAYIVSGNCLFFKSSNSTPLYAVLPEFTEDISGLKLDFTYRNEGVSAYNGTLHVGYMTDPTDTNTFTTVQTYAQTTTLTSVEDVFFADAPAGSYIVFKYEGGSSNNYYLSIDNVKVNYIPTCPKPTDLSAEDITAFSATLNWVGSEAVNDGYMLYYKKVSDADFNVVELVFPPYTLEGLEASSTYEFYVQAVCNQDEMSEPSNSFSFTTACDVITTFPWTENFDSQTGSTSGVNNNLPYCWSYINTCTYNSYKGYPIIYSASGTSYSGTNHLRFYSYYSSYSDYDPQNQYAILPAMADLNGKILSLYARGTNANSSFKVGLMTDPTDMSTFVEIATTNPTTAYEEYEYTLEGEGEYVVIMMEAANSSVTSRSVYIDDIKVSNPPACPRPTNLTVTNITTTSAVLSWESDGQAWDIYIEENGNELNGGIHVTENPYTLENLNPETPYLVKVRTDCGSDDGVSEWSHEVEFTTACEAVTEFPWTEDFEEYNTGNFTTACWQNEHIDGTGTQIFKITAGSSYSTGNNTSHVLQLPDMTAGTTTKLVLPAMTLPGDNYQFVLDVYRSSNTYQSNPYELEGIRVFASTNGEIEGATELAFIPRHYQVSNDVIGAEDSVGWYTYELPIGISGNCYIILRGESQYCTSTYMDNFVVEEMPVTTVTQTTALSSGANWFSSYVEITLDDLKAALVATGNTEITIQGQTQNTIYNPNNGRWTGQLRTLDLSKMYIIKVADACEITLEGMPVDPSMHPVTIAPGVNWIAYPFNTSMTVTNAFAGFAVTNDKVQSQLQNANYNGTRWTGQLRNLEPGQGYIYNSASAETRTFTFPLGN